MYSSQQHHGHSTKLMTKLTQQHNFKCNRQQKYHAQLYVDAVYHMNDMWIVSVIRN